MKTETNQSRLELSRLCKEVIRASSDRRNNGDVIETEVVCVADKQHHMCEKVMHRLTTNRRLLCA